MAVHKYRFKGNMKLGELSLVVMIKNAKKGTTRSVVFAEVNDKGKTGKGITVKEDLPKSFISIGRAKQLVKNYLKDQQNGED